MKKISLLTLSLLASISLAHAQPVWTLGHGDIGIGYDTAGGFEPHWHLGEDGEEVVIDGIPQSNDPNGFEFKPAELILEFSASSPRPAGAAWNFIGVGDGEPVWLLPDTSSDSNLAGVPFLGFGTEELNPADWNGNIVLTLTGITGSGFAAGGFFSVFVNSSNILMQSADGISLADAISLVPNDHVHFNVAFTKPGIYNVTFEITGVHMTDDAQSASGTYTFSVIPEPTSLMLIGVGVGALLLRRRRTRRAF